MKSILFGKRAILFASLTGCLVLCPGTALRASAQANVSPAQAPADPLVWDATQKEVTPKLGAETADFTFSVTNVSDSPVIIEGAHANCGCTTPRLPAVPWVLAPHTNG